MKLKDYVTLGNLLSGFAAVIALFRGAFDWATYLIFIGYLFDVADGSVARITRQHDRFGHVLDGVCDYITNSIMPSFIVYYAYTNVAGFHWLVGATLGAFPLTLGTIRQAKQQVRELSYPCYWLGIARPVLAIFILALLNSSLFYGPLALTSPWREVGYGVVAAVIVMGSLMQQSTFPFANHHGRRWMGGMRFGAYAFLVGSPAWLVLGLACADTNEWFFDYLVVSMVVYLGMAWTQTPYQDWLRIRAYVNGGPLIKPLVHRDSRWRPTTILPFFLERDAGAEETAAALSQSIPSCGPHPVLEDVAARGRDQGTDGATGHEGQGVGKHAA